MVIKVLPFCKSNSLLHVVTAMGAIWTGVSYGLCSTQGVIYQVAVSHAAGVVLRGLNSLWGKLASSKIELLQDKISTEKDKRLLWEVLLQRLQLRRKAGKGKSLLVKVNTVNLTGIPDPWGRPGDYSSEMNTASAIYLQIFPLMSGSASAQTHTGYIL